MSGNTLGRSQLNSLFTGRNTKFNEELTPKLFALLRSLDADKPSVSEGILNPAKDEATCIVDRHARQIALEALSRVVVNCFDGVKLSSPHQPSPVSASASAEESKKNDSSSCFGVEEPGIACAFGACLGATAVAGTGAAVAASSAGPAAAVSAVVGLSACTIM